MKYKKLLVLITCLLFVTVAAFCFASAFKVKDIDLKVTTIVGSSENIEEKVSDYLKNYSNKNLFLISEDEIKSDITSLSGYIKVDSVEKIVPNKLVVKISEKEECFSLKVQDDYYSLDKELVVLNKSQTSLNNVDGNSNILLTLSLADYSSDIKVASKINFYDSLTFNALLKSTSVLYENRGSLSEVVVTTKTDGYANRTFTLKMKEGVEFVIYNVQQDILLKLNKTFEYYLKLDNKGSGSYNVVLTDSGNVFIS